MKREAARKESVLKLQAYMLYEEGGLQESLVGLVASLDDCLRSYRKFFLLLYSCRISVAFFKLLSGSQVSSEYPFHSTRYWYPLPRFL